MYKFREKEKALVVEKIKDVRYNLITYIEFNKNINYKIR